MVGIFAGYHSRSARIPTLVQSRYTAVPYAQWGGIQVHLRVLVRVLVQAQFRYTMKVFCSIWDRDWLVSVLKIICLMLKTSMFTYYYRDQLTLQAARAVGDFAKR